MPLLHDIIVLIQHYFTYMQLCITWHNLIINIESTYSSMLSLLRGVVWTLIIYPSIVK